MKEHAANISEEICRSVDKNNNKGDAVPIASPCFSYSYELFNHQQACAAARSFDGAACFKPAPQLVFLTLLPASSLRCNS